MSACAASIRRRYSTLIDEHGVTHLCGAPIVHQHADQRAEPAQRRGSTTRSSVMIAGAAPPAAMIEGMEQIGFEITHVYGLTETYGPAAVCAWHDGVGRARRSRARRAQGAPGRAATMMQEA